MRMDALLPSEAMVLPVLRHWLGSYHGSLPELYTVGGMVRDLLRSRTPKRIDLVCCNAEPPAEWSRAWQRLEVCRDFS